MRVMMARELELVAGTDKDVEQGSFSLLQVLHERGLRDHMSQDFMIFRRLTDKSVHGSFVGDVLVEG